jgi:hypothetical protein
MSAAPETRAETIRQIWDLKRRSIGPFLQIHPEDVGPNRNRAVLGYIESVMLFAKEKKDEIKRDRAIEATAAQAFVDAMPETMVLTREMARALREAPNIPEFDDELKRRLIVGYAVGKVLLEMICDPVATLVKLFKNAESEFNKNRLRLRVSANPIEHVQKNWWPGLRPVSPLWAASLLINQDRPADEQRFPCTLTDFPEFLAAAEYVRHLAEKRRLAWQGDEKLLGIGDAFAVPPSISLPFPPFPIGDHRELWYSLT